MSVPEVHATVDGAPVRVDLRVELDWALLGRRFADLDSTDQAAFLVGVESGFQMLGVVDGGMQLAYIGDAVPDRSRGDVVGLLRELADAIGGAS